MTGVIRGLGGVKLGLSLRSSVRDELAVADGSVAQLDRASDFESEGRGFESLRARQISECITMQVLQDFEASTASAKITDQGDVLVSFLTDKGHIAVLMRRVVLERLFEQTKSELQRVPRLSRRR